MPLLSLDFEMTKEPEKEGGTSESRTQGLWFAVMLLKLATTCYHVANYRDSTTT